MSSDAEAVAAHTYVFDVVMSCGGCSGAINRKLSKMDGIVSYDVSLDTQKAIIMTIDSVTPSMIFESLQKTGKTIKQFNADGKDVDIEALKAEISV